MSEDIHKWSDGRYTLMFDEHTFFVWDNEKDERMTALNVTKKLNEQQTTIDELEKNFDDLVDWTSEIAKRNVLLDEEIGELRRDHAKWRRKCLDLLVIIRTELLPRISDDEVKRLQKLIDDD